MCARACINIWRKSNTKCIVILVPVGRERDIARARAPHYSCHAYFFNLSYPETSKLRRRRVLFYSDVVQNKTPQGKARQGRRAWEPSPSTLVWQIGTQFDWPNSSRMIVYLSSFPARNWSTLTHIFTFFS